MAVAGNVDKFEDFLVFVPEILHMAIASWEKTKKPHPNELETRISRRLCQSMVKEKRRQDLPFRITPEYSLTDETEEEKESGRIDICLLPSGSPDEDVYFAFECKRLRVPFPSGLKSLSDDYAGEGGMMCFVKRQYGNRLSTGGMIGYVMDGETGKAKRAVKKSIAFRRTELRLAPNTSLEQSSLLPGESRIRETRHDLEKMSFTMHHIFLSCRV